MSFFQKVQNNSLFIHYATIIVVILGVMAYSKMQREARPNVNFNRVTISAFYPGASPADVEELVIDPIEEKIAEVDGVEEYRSLAFSGAGMIAVKIDEEYPDVDEVIDEVRRKVSEVKGLPSGVEDPVVSELKAVNIPVLRLAIYGQLPPFEMKLAVEALKDYLANVPGVQSSSYSGLEDLQLKILADPAKLDGHDVTLLELIANLKRWSRQRPGGLFETDAATANITVGRDYNDQELLGAFIVRSNDSNKQVQLKDLARISYDTEKSQTASVFADKSAVLMTIVKKPHADAVTTVDTVKAALKTYEPNLPEGLSYKLYTDESKRVRDRMRIVNSNALFGLALVLVLLVVFLDWRSALVTSVGIPIAILGGIGLIYLMGNTMNSLVLVGIILVLGMLVDDAIVMCENIFYHLESGLSPLQAAVEGTREIAVAVVATVATTVLAFLPLLFMKGIMGQFLQVIPMTVIAMLMVSLVEAVMVLPVHATEIMRNRQQKRESLFTRIERLYSRYIDFTYKIRWLVLVGVLAFMAASFWQGRVLFANFTLFPATGLEGLSVRVELPRNTGIATTTAKVKELSAALGTVSQDSYDSVYATVGSITVGGHSGSRQNGTNLAMINIVFTSDPGWVAKEEAVVKDIRQTVADFSRKHNIVTSITLDRPGPPIGKPIQLQITARDLDYGQQVVADLKDAFKKIKGVHSLETDLDSDNQRFRFVIDEQLAISEGIDPDQIAATIFAASTGRVTEEILKSNEKVEILVGIREDALHDVSEILQLKIRNLRGQAMPMASFVKVVAETAPGSIQRLNGRRTITLFGEVDEAVTSGKKANIAIQPTISKLLKGDPSLRIETGGGEKDRMEALQDTIRLYGVAMVMIFMAISLSFRSVVYPFIVLLAIPMGLSGVVWALAAHDTPLSLMGLIGVVGLSGVVVNISIILMKCLQERLAAGLAFREAVTFAFVRRLRPIFITTATTLIGLAPTIYGIGGVDHFVQPIALVLGWGLLMAALLSVFTLPALMSFLPFLSRLGHQHDQEGAA